MNLQQQINWYENRVCHLETRIEDFEWEVDQANKKIQKAVDQKSASIDNVNKYTTLLEEARKHLDDCYEQIMEGIK